MFIGMSLLLSSSNEERLECAFMMMDADGSGRVSRDEIDMFLRSIAPRSVSRYEIGALAARIMIEADTNRSGLLDFREFLRWSGKKVVLDWIDAYHSMILSRFGGPPTTRPSTAAARTHFSTKGYPWDGVTAADLVRAFRSEAWAGTLIVSEFERALDRIGLDGKAIGVKLFDAFDQDGSGTLDFREMFLGMAILLQKSHEDRLMTVFDMMDTNQSGLVTHDEMLVFLQFIAPRPIDVHHLHLITRRIFTEADTNRSGALTYTEFMKWKGKSAVLGWIENFHARVLSLFQIAPTKTSALVNKYTKALDDFPWSALRFGDLERAFTSESWASTLNLAEFERVLIKLGLDGRTIGSALFSCFDLDGSGYLDFREVFLGIAMLLNGSYSERLQCLFMLIDDNGSGRLSGEEVQRFLGYIAPKGTHTLDLKELAARIMNEADTNRSGLITFREFASWDGKDTIMAWLDKYHERVIESWGIAEVAAYTHIPTSAGRAAPSVGGYPWSLITAKDVIKAFASESWAGELSLSEFERVLVKLGINGPAVGRQLFGCFDQDGSGMLDFREAFIGLSLLCSGNREERLECAFMMIDENGSGRVSKEEIEVFLRSIAPRSVSRYEIDSLTATIMREVDTDRSGLITFREFILWPGKQAILDWIDAYHSRVLSRWGDKPGVVRAAASSKYPWEGITTRELLSVFQSETWTDELTLMTFMRVLERLGLDGSTFGPRLFDAFDADGSDTLDFRELFIGMALLLSPSRQERLECVFLMMDKDGNGRVNREELELFLNFIAPPKSRTYHVIGAIAQRILKEADTNHSGSVTYHEFNQWDGKDRILGWVDEYHTSVLSRFGNPNGPFVAAKGGYPWDKVSTATLLQVFRSESWGGELIPSEFKRVLTKLGIDGSACAQPLFLAFDTDRTGTLTFREMFIGMSLLLSASYEERLNCVFDMIDSNGSGRVSRDEVEVFLSTVAPSSISSYDVKALSVKVMNEADSNRSGLITFSEFMHWPGKQAVLQWVDAYHNKILTYYMDGVPEAPLRILPPVRTMKAEPDKGAGYPWDNVSMSKLIRAFRQESWGGSLTVAEFRRVLDALDLDGASLGKPLFEAFDSDKSGSLDLREVFIGLALLLSQSAQERFEAVFSMIDSDNSGKISKEEMETFLKLVAPTGTTASKIRVLITLMFVEADTEMTGKISYMEFSKWDGHIDVLAWVDAYHQRILGFFMKSQSRNRMGNPLPGFSNLIYPWSKITTTDVIKAFASESWAGELSLSEFERVLAMLGLRDGAVGQKLFNAFDQDGSGMLDFREAFIGLSLLCSGNREERLECAFMMIDVNGSGRISREEMLLFLKCIAPRSATRQQIGVLAMQIIHEADVNKSGLVTFREFMRWPGKQAVLNWIDAHHDCVIMAAFEGLELPVAPSTADNHPWARMNTKDILRVWRSETWNGQLTVSDFQRLCLRLGGHWVQDRELINDLFKAFDIDVTGLLDFRELFIGLCLLCSESREDRLRCMFSIIDSNGSGRISREELDTFVRFLWPAGDAMADARITLRTSRIMLEADKDRTGFISFGEYLLWDGKQLELKMMDARLSQILTSLPQPKK